MKHSYNTWSNTHFSSPPENHQQPRISSTFLRFSTHTHTKISRNAPLIPILTTMVHNCGIRRGSTSDWPQTLARWRNICGARKCVVWCLGRLDVNFSMRSKSASCCIIGVFYVAYFRIGKLLMCKKFDGDTVWIFVILCRLIFVIALGVLCLEIFYMCEFCVCLGFN